MGVNNKKEMSYDWE